MKPRLFATVPPLEMTRLLPPSPPNWSSPLLVHVEPAPVTSTELLEELMSDPDFEWLMIDASHVKAHQHAAGAKGGTEGVGLTKGGETPRYIWPWMRRVCRSEFLLRQVPWRIARKLAS